MSSKSLKETRGQMGFAEGFTGKHILVAGDLILDEYIWGDVTRVSPEAPVPVVDVRSRTYRCGGAANVAVNVKSLSGHVTLVGAIGRDEAAQSLLRELESCGVDTIGVIEDVGRPTTVKSRIMANNHQMLRLDSETRSELSGKLQKTVVDHALNHLAIADAIVISDYGKGVISSRVAQDLIHKARAENKPVIVDPHGTDYRAYEGATLIKPNIRELERLYNQEIRDDGSLSDVACDLREQLRASAVLVTCGSRGMVLIQECATPVIHHATSHQVLDVTGAGDTVIAVMALAMGSGASFEDSATLANAAAGVVVRKLGTAKLTIDELVEQCVPLLNCGPSNRPSQAESPQRIEDGVGGNSIE